MRCKICNLWDRADAPLNERQECPQCEADRITQETQSLAVWYDEGGRNLMDEFDGYHVIDPETDNPYWDEPENVVNGWRVIGDPELIVHE